MHKQKKENRIKISILSVMFIIFSINLVYAFAVSSGYYKDNPLKLSAGETRDFQLILQNMAGGENLSARASISKGSEIISLIDSSNLYFIPVGSKTAVNLKASIPSNAKIGDVYNIEISFITVADPKAGAFGFGSGVEQKFDVVVVQSQEEIERASLEKTKSKISLEIIIVIIAILIIIAILFIILKVKRYSKK